MIITQSQNNTYNSSSPRRPFSQPHTTQISSQNACVPPHSLMASQTTYLVLCQQQLTQPHFYSTLSPAYATEQMGQKEKARHYSYTSEKAQYYSHTNVIHHKQPACCTPCNTAKEHLTHC